MFIRKIGNNFYWYHTSRKNGKAVSQYLGKATKQEVKRWKKVKKISR
jgi:hypothetical protein